MVGATTRAMGSGAHVAGTLPWLQITLELYTDGKTYVELTKLRPGKCQERFLGGLIASRIEAEPRSAAESAWFVNVDTVTGYVSS